MKSQAINFKFREISIDFLLYKGGFFVYIDHLIFQSGRIIPLVPTTKKINKTKYMSCARLSWVWSVGVGSGGMGWVGLGWVRSCLVRSAAMKPQQKKTFEKIAIDGTNTHNNGHCNL